MIEKRILQECAATGVGAVASRFVMESLHHMIPWLIVMFAVIVCDLFAAWNRCLKMSEPIRVTKAFRDTMGKAVTYFAFVVMVVWINDASGHQHSIDKWSILFICFLEGCSIISNILKPKGYHFNLIAAVGVFAKKVFSIDKEDSKGVITKIEEKEE